MKNGTAHAILSEPAMSLGFLGANNSFLRQYQIHSHVVGLTGKPVYQLEIITKTDEFSLAFQTVEGSVVVSFSITDAVALEIEGNAGHDKYIRLIELEVPVGRTRLHDAECPLL